MAAINFPAQPALQVPENTFSPTSTPFSSKNGVTYVYNAGVWSSSTDAAFVKTSGDHMSGNLSLGSVDGLTNELFFRHTTGQIVSGQYNFSSDQTYGTSITPGSIIIQKPETASTSDKALSVYHGSFQKETLTVFVDGTVTSLAGASFGSDVIVGDTQSRITFDATDGSSYFQGSLECEGLIYSQPSGSVGGVLIDGRNSGQDDLNAFAIRPDGFSSNRIYFDYEGNGYFNNSVVVGDDKITINGTDGSAEFAGNITLGTDKITLSASDGKATFSDYITVNGVDYGLILTTNTAALDYQATIAAQNQASGGPIFAGLAHDWGGAGDEAKVTTKIYEDGSAEFQSAVVSGGDPVNGTNNGCALKAQSGIQATGNADGTYLFRGWKKDSSLNAWIKADGSAEFAGPIDVRNSATQGTKVWNSGGLYIDTDNTTNARVIQIENSTKTPNLIFSVDSNGSASFASDVQIGDVQFNSADKSGIYNKYIASSGYAEVSIVNNATEGSACFVIRSDKVSSLIPGGVVTSLLNDGTTFFAGGRDEFYTDGSFEFYRSNGAADGTLGAFFSDVGGTRRRQVHFKNNGDIEAGTVTPKNVVFNLEPDNAANYTTTTDSEGVETSIYTGPTLDVKDRLQKADNALSAIKIAAADNSITTLGDFKLAILNALANI